MRSTFQELSEIFDLIKANPEDLPPEYQFLLEPEFQQQIEEIVNSEDKIRAAARELAARLGDENAVSKEDVERLYQYLQELGMLDSEPGDMAPEEGGPSEEDGYPPEGDEIAGPDQGTEEGIDPRGQGETEGIEEEVGSEEGEELSDIQPEQGLFGEEGGAEEGVPGQEGFEEEEQEGIFPEGSDEEEAESQAEIMPGEDTGMGVQEAAEHLGEAMETAQEGGDPTRHITQGLKALIQAAGEACRDCEKEDESKRMKGPPVPPPPSNGPPNGPPQGPPKKPSSNKPPFLEDEGEEVDGNEEEDNGGEEQQAPPTEKEPKEKEKNKKSMRF